MNKVIAVCLVVLVATIGVAAYAYTFYLPGLTGASSSSQSSNGLGGPGTGTLNIYLTDAPAHNSTLKYLLVNVTSVTLKYSSNLTETTTTTSSSSSITSTSSGTSSTTSGTTSSSSTSPPENRFSYNVTTSAGLNVNLTKLQGTQLLLTTSKVPAGNVTGIVLNISGAEAFWTDGSHAQLKVVADGKLMINVQFQVQPNGSANLTIDLTPGGIHVSPGNGTVLRPVIHVTAVSSGPNGTTTTETSETVTETTTSTTS